MHNGVAFGYWLDQRSLGRLRRRRRALALSGFLEAIGAAEFLAESLHPSGRIDELVLAGEKRMACRADIDIDLGDGGAGGERIAAGTVGRAVLVARMNFGFHEISSCPRTCVRLHTSRRQPGMVRKNRTGDISEGPRHWQGRAYRALLMIHCQT